MANKQWLTTDEFAQEVLVSQRTVQSWIREGREGLIVDKTGLKRYKIHRDSIPNFRKRITNTIPTRI